MTVLADTRDAAAGRHPAESEPGPTPVVRLAVGRWQSEPRVLTGRRVLLREVRAADALLLRYHMQSANADNAVGEMPANLPDFERFIEWARRERTCGRLLTYSVVDRDTRAPAGLFQAWPRTPDGLVAEWGFGIGCAYWGTGFFLEAAVLLIDDLFGPRRVQRLEAVTCACNLRGATALRRLGAARQGTEPPGEQTLWVLTGDEWRQRRGQSWPEGDALLPTTPGGRR